MKFLKYLSLSLLILGISFKLPSLHYNYVRNSVGSRTVRVLRSDGVLSGGTGIHVALPSGGVAILTNAHVCGLKDANNNVLVDSEWLPAPMIRHVIEQADFTDLCVIEPVPGMDGISLGSESSPGEIVAAVGHPHLIPLTMTRGEIVGTDWVYVIDHMMTGDPADKCDLPKNKIMNFDLGFFVVQVCTIHIKAIYTTVTILPGNSGSAMVNAYGHLIGLCFAGDSSSNWALAVTLEDIKKFLANK